MFVLCKILEKSISLFTTVVLLPLLLKPTLYGEKFEFFDGDIIKFFSEIAKFLVLSFPFVFLFWYDFIFSFVKGLFSNKNIYIIKYISEFTFSITFLNV